MCIANYEASGSQVQITLERGIPALIGSFGTKQLPYPYLSFDMVHCAKCNVDWDKNGTHPLVLFSVLANVEKIAYRVQLGRLTISD
jgi:hypothetical protein